MDNIAASREFEVYNGENVKIGTVHVLVNTPVWDTNVDGGWNCKYRVSAFNNDKIMNAYGEDSLQALLLCIKKIEAELHYYQKANNVELRWLGLKGLGLGTEFI